MANTKYLVNASAVAPLKLIALPGCEEMAKTINKYLIQFRQEISAQNTAKKDTYGYATDNYIIDVNLPRFGSGEGKGVINESVRGVDLFILVDVCNYSVTYSEFGNINHMSPDDHFQNLKRVIAAANGKAHRISVMMPFLYEGRQHKRTGRESLDCALALQELVDYGVTNILTFDAHDPRVMNSIPLHGFDNFFPTYQFLKALLKTESDIQISNDHLMIISPDEGAMSRAIYFSNVLGVDMGMFYKRRDYSRIVNGKNPIVAHEFLGDNVEGKDVIIVDDMISSGASMIEVATKLKELHARRIFICTCFGLFCNGLDVFDQAYKDGVFYRVFTTNGVYQTPELLSREWYVSVELSKYTAYFIDTLNHDMSVSTLLDSSEKIKNLLIKKGLKG